MDNKQIEKFSVIGISVRTTNENGEAAKDIPQLWNRFITENIASKIPNKINSDIYCIYTDYEKDHTKPYTTILGCKVENLETIPNEMVGKIVSETIYKKYVATGNILQGSVYNEWTKIWNADLPRTFTADFEVYGDKAKDFENAEVELFIAVK